MSRAPSDIAAIFHAARELATPQERSVYLGSACGNDESVRARVEALLRAHESATAFLEPLAVAGPTAADESLLAAPDSADGPTLLGDDAGTRDSEGSTIDAGAPGLPASHRQHGHERPGATIDRFKLLERLGEGGFGTVWLAEQRAPVKRRVALKIIKLGMDTKQVIARFEAERQALAMMDHANIARVFDAGATDTGRPYFVMELVDGAPITQFCDQHTASIDERLKLFILVCQAVQHAHTKGIIHRDLKPSNILVTTAEGSGLRAAGPGKTGPFSAPKPDVRTVIPIPKIIDFGIAKATNAELTEKTLFSEQRQFIGTPTYMSPEQAQRSGLDIDTRSDIYSLGVLLYELLTGTVPFDKTRLLEAGYAGMQRIICEETPPRPSARLTEGTRARRHEGTQGMEENPIGPLRASVPAGLRASDLRGDLDWIVMKCLEKDRTRRYETANGLAMDVERHLRNEPVAAGPPNAAYQVRKFVRRNRAGVFATSLLTLILVLGIIGTSIGFVRARLAADKARDAESVALAEKALARRQAYSAIMLGASDAMERGQIDAARQYLDSAPSDLRGWEWRHLASRLDPSLRVHEQQPTTWRLHAAPDGQSYYGVARDPTRSVQHWDIETGRLLDTIPMDRPCWASWLVADGTQLVMHVSDTASGAGSVDVWDLRRRARVSSWPVPNAAKIAPDGVLAAYVWQNRIHVLDLRTGAVRESPADQSGDPQGWGNGLCFQPDGRRMAAEWSVGQIRLVDVDSFQVLSTFEAHDNLIWDMEFSPDGKLLASVSSDGTLRLTDVASNPPVAKTTLRGHRGIVWDVSFSPDGSLLASRGEDQTIRLWDVRMGGARGEFHATSDDSGSIAFLPDSQTLIGADDNGAVHFWDVRSAEDWILRGHRSYVNPVLISPDGATVYSGGWDGFRGQPGCLRVWDADSGEQVAVTGAVGSTIPVAALSRDGSRLALLLVGNTRRIEIIDTATGATISTISAEEGDSPGSLAFDPDGRRLAWVNNRGALVLSDAFTGAAIASRPMLEKTVAWPKLAWSPDGTTIATCDHVLGTLSTWDGDSLEPLRHWKFGQYGRGCSLAFSPDSRRIVTATESGVVRVWDAATGTLVHELVGTGNRPLCVSYSPDGARITIGGYDNYVRMWDARTFEPVARLCGHENYVYSLAWRKDGRMLFSGSGDHTVRIWDTRPVKDRMQARRERQAIVARVEPMVARLFDELRDAGRVVKQVKADSSLTVRERQVALQLVLAASIARLDAAASQPAR